MNNERPRLRRIIDDVIQEMRYPPQRGPRRRGPPLPLVPQLPRPVRQQDPRIRIRATTFRRYMLASVAAVVAIGLWAGYLCSKNGTEGMEEEASPAAPAPASPTPALPLPALPALLQQQLCPALTTENILTAYDNPVFTQLYTHCILSPSSSSASCVLPPDITLATASMENTTTHLFYIIAQHFTLSNNLLADQLRTWDALRDLSAGKNTNDVDRDDDLQGMWLDYPFPLPDSNPPPTYSLQPVQTLFRRRFTELVSQLDESFASVSRAATSVTMSNAKTNTKSIFNTSLSNTPQQAKPDSDSDSEGRSFLARIIPHINKKEDENQDSSKTSPHHTSHHHHHHHHHHLLLSSLLATHLSTASTLDLQAYTLASNTHSCNTILSTLYTSFTHLMKAQKSHERRGGPRLDALWIRWVSVPLVAETESGKMVEERIRWGDLSWEGRRRLEGMVEREVAFRKRFREMGFWGRFWFLVGEKEKKGWKKGGDKKDGNGDGNRDGNRNGREVEVDGDREEGWTGERAEIRGLVAGNADLACRRLNAVRVAKKGVEVLKVLAVLREGADAVTNANANPNANAAAADRGGNRGGRKKKAWQDLADSERNLESVLHLLQLHGRGRGQ